MKSILLTTTAIVAFAGAAVADGHTGVSFGGDAELGYNDEFDNGIFWSFGLSVSGAAELDNGLTATISGDVELINEPEVDDMGTLDTSDDVVTDATGASAFDGNDVQIDDLVIGFGNDDASLKFGDTAPAADSIYSSAVTNIDADGFNDEDDIDDEDGVLIGTATFGETTVGVSYGIVASNDEPDDDITGLQIGATTSISNFTLSFGYQEEISGTTGSVGGVDTPNTPEIYAVSASTTFSGIDLGLSYAEATGEDTAGDEVSLTSIGVQAAYTFDAVTATVFYVSNDLTGGAGDWDDNYGIAVDYASGPLTVGVLYHDGEDEDLQVNVDYAVNDALSVFAGYRDEGENGADVEQAEITYVGGDYNLGGGANLRISYAEVDEGAGGTASTLDELGKAEDVKVGTTVAVSFTF